MSQGVVLKSAKKVVSCIAHKVIKALLSNAASSSIQYNPENATLLPDVSQRKEE